MSSPTPFVILLILAATACAGPQPTGAAQRAAAASTGSLSSGSGIACHQDSDCDVCFRADSCGEPVAAGDPTLATPACHVSPAPFCMPRRAHCDSGRCVAR